MKSQLLSMLVVIAAFSLPARTSRHDQQLHARQSVAFPHEATALVANDGIRVSQDVERRIVQRVGLRRLDLGARESHLVRQFNLEFPAIQGEGITVVIFGPGRVRETHVEFRLHQSEPHSSRVLVKTKKALDRYSTYLAGVIGAQGRNAEAKGMAPLIKLISEDLDNHLVKLRALAPYVQIATHYQFKKAGWDKDSKRREWFWWGDPRISQEVDSSFGKYGNQEAEIDDIIYSNRHLLLFAPAGNDRNDGPEKQPIRHRARNPNTNTITWISSDRVRNVDGANKGGLDTIIGLGLAKNVVCVGSIDDVTLSNPITSEDYSGWGPADDGRIKPDLVANGYRVLSSSSASDIAYHEDTGSSTASAAAAGIGGLLMELLQKERPHLMGYAAAVIKASLIHTATDDRRLKGPDARFGWGSINALKAGQTISMKKEGKFCHFIDVAEVGKVESTKRKHYEFESMGGPVRATLVWIDPPGSPNSLGLDDATPALQNDLDIRLINPNGQVSYPYRLDRSNPLSQAKRDGPNRVDNVEVVDASAAPGKWEVEVVAANLKKGLSQRFALVVSGLK